MSTWFMEIMGIKEEILTPIMKWTNFQTLFWKLTRQKNTRFSGVLNPKSSIKKLHYSFFTKGDRSY